ncbi:MAG TPA: DapH/DapD/GlmU-related protein [Phycisphaerae bacterium]|nr:DapH/DapD/GlmU-related protein [Phycisphaerae bacterium]HRY66527.1 DapH/DapD/GlmU-related protein [Phycisphaerae bacterium]HSA28639.1 DapH/DapD/GlmU-related protein [Phycisphaerae bacterium]
MLKSVVRGVRRLLGQTDSSVILAQMDIGAGSRLSVSNLDGMFPQLIHIGRNCIFAPTAMVLAHDASYYLFTGEYRVAPVWIGDHVFVGYGAILMPGVRVGNNVVIGAGSVVTRNVDSDSVVAGVPARVVCPLNEYLEGRRKYVMCEPPYAGKRPRDMNPEDVEQFRRMVYDRFRTAGGPPTGPPATGAGL